MKKRMEIYFIFLCLTFNLSAQKFDFEKHEITDELVLRKIEDNAFLVTHVFPWPGNSLLVKVSESDFILVDTPWTNSATKILLEWVRDQLGDINLKVINTHFHMDNLGGNAYLQSQNIPCYGSHLTKKLLNEKKEALIERTLKHLTEPRHKKYYEEYKDNQFVTPDHLFNIDEGKTLKVGDETIEIFYPGPGHTDDNIVVYFKNRNLLFGGCLIKSLEAKSVGMASDGNMEEWPNSVKKLIEKYKDCKIVVPGHGVWGDISLLHHTIKLFEERK